MTFRKLLSPYPIQLTLRLHKSKRSIAKHLSSSDIGLTTLLENGSITVDIAMIAQPDTLFNIAVHESVHVSQFIQKTIETTFDDETSAYITADVASWISSKIARNLRR